MAKKWQKIKKKRQKWAKNGDFSQKNGKNAVKREIFGVAGFGFQTVDTGAGA
ncbi:MAG TPA: hypothetical protein PKM67_06210 [Kiritimatiellia bacterium]|nr:hypothetical protein [Kiritimatiellia bacterium]HNS81034.1 hypothetical protein [Kiritimatiellia bacterium]HPA78491.1 hypothetical protein [Kiritimatiellia bacterium]